MHAALDQLSLPRPRVEQLLGTWHIVRTNFPMWLNPRNRAPRFEYGAIAGHDDRMSDCVRYRRGGRDKAIRGVDRQDPGRPCHFTWRGRGLLALLRSEWFVLELDGKAGLAAILFTETLFTPAGLDIVTRAADPARELISACVERLGRAPALAKDLAELVEIDQALLV